MSNRSVYKRTKKPPRKDALPAGRPSKMEIDENLMKKLRQAILIGAPVLTAAALNDISYDTMRAWVLKGKENPDSQYGALLKLLARSIAEYETKDLAVIERHAMGAPAQFLEEPVVDSQGVVQKDAQGKVIMKPVRDSEGNPILKSKEIESDWRAAMERLSRRVPRSWARHLNVDLDAVLTFDNKEREVNPKEAMSFEQRIKEAVRELEDEV